MGIGKINKLLQVNNVTLQNSGTAVLHLLQHCLYHSRSQTRLVELLLNDTRDREV